MLMGWRAPRRAPSGWHGRSAIWGRVPDIDETVAKIDAVTPERLREFRRGPRRAGRTGPGAARAGRRMRPIAPRSQGGWRPEARGMLRFRRATAPAIETQRLVLRLPEMGDHAAWALLRRQRRGLPARLGADLVERPLLAPLLSQPRLLGLARARGGPGAGALPHPPRGRQRLLGAITLDNIRRGPSQSAQIGYWIGPDHARQGYMTEALAAVVHHALHRARPQPHRGGLPAGERRRRAACSSAPASSTRAWPRATCRSTAAGATTCSTPICATTAAGGRPTEDA